jgi:hypothetical protein
MIRACGYLAHGSAEQHAVVADNAVDVAQAADEVTDGASTPSVGSP